MKVPTKIRPMANYMLVTYDKYTDEDFNELGILEKNTGTIKEFQTVIAKGPMVRNIEVGETVSINLNRYAFRKHENGSLKDNVITDNPITGYNVPTINLDGITYLMITDQDVDFVVEEFKEVEAKKTPNIIIPDKKIIL